MITTRPHGQAFLIVTKRLSRHVIRHYRRIHEATRKLGDVYLLLHTNDGAHTPQNGKINIEPFTNSILDDLQYRPIRRSLVPGSNHFPVMKFFLSHPNYEYYWCIEDDVAFTGKWNHFFENLSEGRPFDFITSHIRQYHQMPDWAWWDSLRVPHDEMASEDMLNSFNPIYRISNHALQYIDRKLKAGCRGHHEVLLPSLLSRGGFSLADLSAQENELTPALSFCTLATMRYKPVFVMTGSYKNLLYHPVKEKISLKELIVYVKRTIEKRKEYLS